MMARRLLVSIPWTHLSHPNWSRILLNQNHPLIAAFATSSAIREANVGKNKFAKFGNDPDTFGTLTGTSHESDIARMEDEGDQQEEEYLGGFDGDRKTTRQYGKDIEQLLEKGRLKEALQVLEVEMKEKRAKPDRHTYGLLIGACGRAGYTKKAFALYNDMKRRGIEPTEGIYTALFNSCANAPWQSDGLQRARKLRSYVQDKGLFLNRLQYHSMIKAFGRCGDLETALEIVKEMRTARLAPTAETYSFLLQACVSDKTRGFESAIRVWRQLRNSRITPDLFLYNLMLRITRDCNVDHQLQVESLFSLGGDSTAAQETRPQIAAGSSSLPATQSPESEATSLPNFLAPQVNASSSIVALSDLDRPKNRLALLGGVEGFLEQMKQDHVHPDIKTYTQLLECMTSTRAVENILLKHMTENNVKPDVDFFNMLIKKRSFRADLVGAKQVLGLIRSHNLFPDIATFGVLSLGCKYQRDAEEFLHTMEQAGFRVNIEIFGSLLKNAIQIKDFYYVIYLMNRAVDWKLPLGEKILLLLQKFRENCKGNILKSERGERVHEMYKSPKFQEGYKYFEFNLERWLSSLPADVPAHPWDQYRYKKEDD